MNAASNVIEFKLPAKRPKVIEKPMPPDQRRMAVAPLRAVKDKRITDSQLRTLLVLCSYTNRAGITWVRQERIGQDLGVSKQSISKQMKRLVELGYVEIVSRGFRGEKANTLRVIFDESISADDAISLTSSIEDTRPPERIRKDQKAMEDDNLPNLTPEQIEANKRRLSALLATMATQKTGINHQERTMPNETETVKAIKKRIAEKRPKARPKPVDNSVDNLSKPVDNLSLHSQPHSQLNRVDQNEENLGIDKVYKVIDKVNLKTTLGYVQVNLTDTDARWLEHLVDVGVTESQLTHALQTTKRKTVAEVARDLLAAKGLA